MKNELNKLSEFSAYLKSEEKSKATVEKYMRDIGVLIRYAGGREINKALVLEYKNHLICRYAVASANSMIAAINSYFRYCGRYDLCVKQFRVQRQIYCPEEKELSRAEYMRLVAAAKQNGNYRLSLILQTICGTGIRVSELRYITVEALHRGEAIVDCKGKTRRVFIVTELRKKLLAYAKEKELTGGAIFVNKNGPPVNRSSIWRDMKALCKSAKVSPGKVFPHNLRHLFARTFYSIEKDVVRLADILGHANVNTTRIYTVTTGAEHKRKMENMRLVL